jgi:hypothetical protein
MLNLGLLQLLDVIVVSDCVPPLSSVEMKPRLSNT